MNKAQLKELVKNIMTEESEYQAFFKKALEKSGKSIPSMSDEEKKAFFNKIDAAWDGRGEKNEALVGNQHKLDVDGDGDIEGDDLADLRAGKKADEAVELPKASIPSGVKSKLDMAIDKIKDSNLTYNQKIQVVGQVMDSLGIDKAEFNKMASKLKGTMESVVNEAETFTATNKATGKTSVFKSKDSRDAAVKAGTHAAIKDPNDGGKTKGGVNIFNNPTKASNDKGNDGFGWGPETDRTPATSLPKKASQLDDKHASVVEDTLNKETGLDGIAQIDDNTGAIMFNASKGDMPTYTLYVGSNVDYGKPNEFRVSMESTYGNDPAGLEDAGIDKSFKTAEEAMAFAAQVAKKYKKELEMDDDTNESSKYVTERVSPKEMDAIKSAVQSASSFMGIGSELKKLGMKYTFATEPLPIYIIQPTPNNKVAIVNKKYASKPDFVHGDIAVGVMEGKTSKSVNEGRAFINAARKAKNEGLTEFEFNGKKYPVTIKD